MVCLYTKNTTVEELQATGRRIILNNTSGLSVKAAVDEVIAYATEYLSYPQQTENTQHCAWLENWVYEDRECGEHHGEFYIELTTQCGYLNPVKHRFYIQEQSDD